MTELLLLRHAHAGDPAAWTKADDIRPLSKKGRDQAARMAAFLARVDVRPDVIVSSPRTRAVETARPVADVFGLGVREDERLAEPFGLAEIERLLGAGPDLLVDGQAVSRWAKAHPNRHDLVVDCATVVPRGFTLFAAMSKAGSQKRVYLAR